ncbi:MAG: TM2 domain-containing protein [Chitinophagaceae bacterium]|nr:MAG: TM2 domain-containing protein [Chitinophagaceae bacterium]
MDTSFLLTLPGIDNIELQFLQNLVTGMNDQQKQQFLSIYGARRKDPQTILLLSLLGLVVIAGIHRFVLEEIGMGILYFFTGGLCLIGTIVDAINYKSLTWKFNQAKALESANIARSFAVSQGTA